MSLALLHSPADVIRQMLVDLGVGTAFDAGGAWPVFDSTEPQSPDQVLTVYDTTPKDDGRSMIDGETWCHFGVQVRIRSNDPKTGWAKADEVHTAFDESTYDETVHVDSNIYLVHSVNNTTLLTLGVEAPDSKRFLHTVNCTVSLKRVS